MSHQKVVNLVLLAALVGGLFIVPSLADSQARIVRLSSVEGDVQIDRDTGQGYEKAFLNLPIVEGVKIKTGASGRAEIEFEDGSAARLTPRTVIEVTQLALRDSGTKSSALRLDEGTCYLNFLAQKDSRLTLNFGRETMALTQPAHLRVAMGDTDATVAVFKGDVKIEGASGTVEAGKKQTVTFDLADHDTYALAKTLEEDPYDAWDKQQSEYHDRYASNNSYTSSPYGYGMSDLNYYGSYSNIPGYGNLWQPYFAGAGWDPFMNGTWLYSPGFGYNWVSAYPWGWAPYYYGSWLYAPGYGWGWQPGTNWYGWNNFPHIKNGPRGFVAPAPPATAVTGPVVVNRGGFPAPTAGGRKVTIREGSAGLGIPRGSVKNLGSLSTLVRQNGSATTTVHPVRVGTAFPASSAHGTSSPRMSSPSPRMTTPTTHTTRSTGHAPHK